MKILTEHLEHISEEELKKEAANIYMKRPKGHLIIAWILVAIVVFAFLGMCYWMVAYGRI